MTYRNSYKEHLIILLAVGHVTFFFSLKLMITKARTRAHRTLALGST